MSIIARDFIQSQISGCKNVITELQGALDHHRRQLTMLEEILASIPAPEPPVHTSLPFDPQLPEGSKWNEEGQYYELPDGTRRAQAGWQ